MNEPAHRVLHIVEPSAAECGPCALALARSVDALRGVDASRALVIGDGTAAQEAEACGLHGTARVNVASAAPWSAWRAFGHAIQAAASSMPGARDAKSPLVIHAWSWHALILLSLPGPHRSMRIVAGVLRQPASRLERAVLKRLVRRGASVLVPSDAAREELAAMLPSSARVHATGCWNDPPRGRLSRAELRRQWNEASDVDDQTLVVGMVGETPGMSNAWIGSNMGLRAMLGGWRVRLVASPAANRFGAARELAVGFNCDRLFIQDARIERPWEVTAGLDAVVTLMTDNAVSLRRARWLGIVRPNWMVLPWSMASTACAMAAGVPVVAEATSATREAIRDGENGFLVKPGDWNLACGRIMDFCADPGLRTRTGEAGRHTVSGAEARARMQSAIAAAHADATG